MAVHPRLTKNKFRNNLLRGANSNPLAVITGKTGLWVQKGVWDILMGMLVTLYFRQRWTLLCMTGRRSSGQGTGEGPIYV